MADSDIVILSAAAVGGVGQVTLSWTKTGLSCLPLIAPDVVEVHMATVNNRASSSKIGESAIDRFTHQGITVIADRYYWFRARDASGSLGDFYPVSSTAGVVGTPRKIATADIIDDAIDETKIADDSIATPHLKANAVTAKNMTIGSRPVTLEGVVFTCNSTNGANTVTNRLHWTSGTLRWVGDNNLEESNAIPSSFAAYSSGVLYIYWIKNQNSLFTTTNANTALTGANVLIGTYRGGIDFKETSGRTTIEGGFIRTKSIKAESVDVDDLLAVDAAITGQLRIGPLVGAHILIDAKAGANHILISDG